MKYYVYVRYYENFISGHKLSKPYELEKQFNDLEDAIEYVIDKYDDDSLFYTDDVIDEAIELGYVPNDEDWKDFLMEESNKSSRKSIKESKYKVSDFKNTSNRQISISYIDEEDNPLWVGSPDELNDCDYLDYNVEEVGEEGKTLYLSIEESKKFARKSIKEDKMILSFEAFKDICVEEIGYSYIGSFEEYKGTYFVSVIDDKRVDKFCKYLRNNYDCECTFWKITDPYDYDYGFYRVEVI